MRDPYKYNHSEILGTANQAQDCGARPVRDPRIPLALRNLENQSECLHDAISRLAERLSHISRPSVPEEDCRHACMEPVCEVEGFVARQAESIVLANQRINDLLERLEI